MSNSVNAFDPQVQEDAMTAAEDRNKAFVLEAFDTLFNQRDYAAAQRFWSPDYIQHSAHIAPGRDCLFNLIRASPPAMRYENALIVANDDYVMLRCVPIPARGQGNSMTAASGSTP
jgi:predicted SnoaL-like aldol condensation-catalyzing enzyme